MTTGKGDNYSFKNRNTAFAKQNTLIHKLSERKLFQHVAVGIYLCTVL